MIPTGIRSRLAKSVCRTHENAGPQSRLPCVTDALFPWDRDPPPFSKSQCLGKTMDFSSRCPHLFWVASDPQPQFVGVKAASIKMKTRTCAYRSCIGAVPGRGRYISTIVCLTTAVSTQSLLYTLELFSSVRGSPCGTILSTSFRRSRAECRTWPPSPPLDYV